jgi:hypothetical protein
MSQNLRKGNRITDEYHHKYLAIWMWQYNMSQNLRNGNRITDEYHHKYLAIWMW